MRFIPKTTVVLALASAAVLAAACEVHDPKKYELGPTALNDALNLTPASTTLPADGVSRVSIIAALDPATAATNRDVRFTTTLGRLFGDGKDGTDVTVRADSTGRATVELRSEQRTGTANVRATAGTLTRAVDITFTALAASDVVTLSLASTSPPADNATVTDVVANVNPAFAGHQVQFTLEPRGRLTSASAPIDSTGRAHTSIVSPPLPGSARLTAVVDTFAAVADLTFTRSLPTQIQVTLSDVRAPATVDTKIAVTARLLREVGVVTPGTVVTFTVVDSNGTVRGAFSNVSLSLDDGTVTAVYQPGATTFRGTVTIAATAQNTSISGSATLEIVDP